MDYYEELGLKRTASGQEIRQAYKVMARLVHPDGQADQQVQAMAQRQMQRLNEILAILTNEQSRREYDAGLGGAAAVAIVTPPVRPVRWGKRPKAWEAEAESWTARLPVWAQVAVRNGFWISLALVLVCVGVWYIEQDTGNSAHAGSTQEMRPAAAERPRATQAEAKREAAPAERRNDEESTAVSAEDATAATASTAPLPVVTTEPPVGKSAAESAVMEPAVSTAAAPAKQEAPAEMAGFAGNWLFVPDPAETIAPGSYPATYVELLLAEDRGQLMGRYRAHYRVADRAVSPEVSFQVQGVRPGGKSAHLQWSSLDGARGEVDMALVGPNLMTLSWWSTELGRHATLASGTAKLVRQRAR